MLSLTKANHLSKYGITKTLKTELDNVLENKDYIEVVSGGRILLNLKTKNGMEILFVEDEKDYIFLKNIRDNHEEIKKLARQNNIIDKMVKNKIDENHFFVNRLKHLNIKKTNQLLSLVKKIDDIKDRLQNVFIINSDFASFIKTFDQNNCVFVFSDFSPVVIESLKKVRYSEVLVFFYDCSIPYKKLKELNFKNLISNKESTKFIWHKSNK
jgi:hypothetical protein